MLVSQQGLHYTEAPSYLNNQRYSTISIQFFSYWNLLYSAIAKPSYNSILFPPIPIVVARLGTIGFFALFRFSRAREFLP